MDIRKFDSVTKAEIGVALVLLDPVTKVDTGAAIVLCGADSSVYKAARKELDASKKGLGRELSTDEHEAQLTEVLARCTKGWSGLLEDGKEIPFSQTKAKSIYTEYPELRDRVSMFIHTRANFFASASGS